MRRAFADILKTLFEYAGPRYLRVDDDNDLSSSHTVSSKWQPDVDKIIGYLISLVKKEAIERWTISTGLFAVFHFYAMRSRDTCRHLLERSAFRALLHFLFILLPTSSI